MIFNYIISNPKDKIQTMLFPFFRYFSFFTFSFLPLIISPAFPARILPDSVTVITPSHNASWHTFSKFIDASVGDHVAGMSQLKRYFNRFGYLPDTKNLSDTFDTQFESAVVSYQTNLGLPVTGKLDSDTVSLIMSPRCGVGDAKRNDTGSKPGFHVTKHFAYFYGKPRWNRRSPATLTYALSSENIIDYISRSEIRTVLGRAFARWAEVIPVIFLEVDDQEPADIRIGFHRGDHGDGEPFDGVLGVLAHAFSPENGRFHLDAAETWAVDFDKVKDRAAVDLESVATHEIGHVLGLAHSSVREAVMYPSLRPRSKKVELRIDDVEGIQALYGSNPNFRLSSLLESENSSNSGGIGLMSGGFSKWTISLTVTVLIQLWRTY